MLCKTILIDWFLKRYEIWNLWNVITNLKWIYRIIFWGQNEKIGHDISDLLRPNCPLDRLTNDNNSKINPDNTNKMGTMASTFFLAFLRCVQLFFRILRLYVKQSKMIIERYKQATIEWDTNSICQGDKSELLLFVWKDYISLSTLVDT